jgi:hypothetical protein
VNGAPPLNVLLGEVGLKESETPLSSNCQAASSLMVGQAMFSS